VEVDMREQRSGGRKPAHGRAPNDRPRDGRAPHTTAALRALVLAAFACAVPVGARAQLEVGSSAEIRERRARAADPRLEATPPELKAEVAAGETASLRLTVSNAGGRSLRWRARCDVAGALLEPVEGELAFRGSQEVQLSLIALGVPGESVSGEVVVEAEGVDGSPIRIAIDVGIVEPPPPVPPETVPAGGAPLVRDRAHGRGLGARVGYALPSSGEQEEFAGGPSAGVHYRTAGKDATFGFEFSVDLVNSESGWTEATSSLLLAGAAALYRPRREGSLYLLGGGRFVSEQVSVDDAAAAVATALDLGAGASLAGGKLDLRATYSALLGSDNVPGFASVAVGYGF
jgi:hypothetical protein